MANSLASVVLPELAGPTRAKDRSAQQWSARLQAAKAARCRIFLASMFPMKRARGQTGEAGSVSARRMSSSGMSHWMSACSCCMSGLQPSFFVHSGVVAPVTGELLQVVLDDDVAAGQGYLSGGTDLFVRMS